MQCLKKNELKEGDKSDLQELIRMMAEAKLKGRLIEKVLLVGKSFSTKKVNGKEYRYPVGVVHVKLPADLIGKKVKVVVIPVD